MRGAQLYLLISHGLEDLWKACSRESEKLGAFVVIPVAVFCVICTVLGIPVDFLLVGSGAMLGSTHGVINGSALAFAACCIGVYFGGLAAFALGRSFLKPHVESYIDRFQMLKAINTVIETDGWKFAFVMRLSPLIPNEPLNYACSCTSMSFRQNALATFGSMPKTAYEVWLGVQAATLSSSGAQHDSSFTICSNAIFLVLMVVMCLLAKRRYDQHVDDSPALHPEVRHLMKRSKTLQGFNNLARQSRLVKAGTSCAQPLLNTEPLQEVRFPPSHFSRWYATTFS